MKPVFPYADIVSGGAEGVVELYDPDQGARIKKFDVRESNQQRIGNDKESIRKI